MQRYNWSALTHLQIGRYAEFLVKMEFTMFGFDVFTAEIDDKGIDLIVRKNDAVYYDVQVKSARLSNTSYIFIQKDKFELRDNLYAVIVLFDKDGKAPNLYLIPSKAWEKPNDLFRDREYKDKKSKPEWGLNISRRNLPILQQYPFDSFINQL
ncbi:MAG: DUF4365 domain-containing protein [Syntrophomonadaceae bacterium]|nr:DUF4365 domain-containing protein [Syntrophomonadaceae bacterium]